MANIWFVLFVTVYRILALKKINTFVAFEVNDHGIQIAAPSKCSSYYFLSLPFTLSFTFKTFSKAADIGFDSKCMFYRIYTNKIKVLAVLEVKDQRVWKTAPKESYSSYFLSLSVYISYTLKTFS